jgi:hypothetical protein
MGARGRLENAAWILGVTLMLTYGAARVWAERERETAIAAFENARLLQASQSSHPLRSSMQAGRGVDQSLWSPQRIAAYAAAPHDTHDVKNVPIALLRIPDVQLEVPVFNGTGEANLNRGGCRDRAVASYRDFGGNRALSHRGNACGRAFGCRRARSDAAARGDPRHLLSVLLRGVSAAALRRPRGARAFSERGGRRIDNGGDDTVTPSRNLIFRR